MGCGHFHCQLVMITTINNNGSLSLILILPTLLTCFLISRMCLSKLVGLSVEIRVKCSVTTCGGFLNEAEICRVSLLYL